MSNFDRRSLRSFFPEITVRKDGFPPLKGTCIGIYTTTSPYSVTGGANAKIAFVLLQDGSFFTFIGNYFVMFQFSLEKIKIFLKDLKGGICCVPEGRYEPEFCRP